VDFPIRVASTGGRFRFNDDQETPDTQSALYEFPENKAIEWLGLSCTTAPLRQFDILFHGEKGSLGINGGGYAIHDERGKEVRKESGNGGDAEHLRNFLEAIRGNAKLNSEIEEGHKSTLLCHLGNIAYRTGQALTCDATNGHIADDKQAQALWSRTYEPGWEPKV
jgi:predicted dehydrogenase